jgi:crotonobetainyl-CoA:carnitine CoA-transferase CaiB-like acyl-CoA transferase
MATPSVEGFPGVRVVEVAQFVFVPVAGALLADWGADVIKIEHPRLGDGYRGLVSQGIMKLSDGINQSWELANRGKKSVGIDIATPAGHDLLLQLVATADVFLTNFLPSTLQKLHLDVDELRQVNPRLIYARGHGQGVRGPDADKAAYDATAFWARGGLGEILTPPDAEEPIGQRGAFGDRNAAVQLAFGIATALFRRERTGEPSVVDVSLLATAMWTLASDVISALQGNFVDGRPPERSKGLDVPNPLANTYQTQDKRFLTLMFLQLDRYWPELCQAIGRPDLVADPRFVDSSARTTHRRELAGLLTDVFQQQPYAHWCAQFADERFPWAPFQSIPEVIEDRQVAANGYLGDVFVDETTSFRLPTGAVQFDEKPAALVRAPEHGQNTEEVLLDLGLTWEDLARYKQDGVIV